MSSGGPQINTAEYWNEAAAGWIRHRELLRDYLAPVSQWLVDAVDPQPGWRVLELAAGLGDTGLMLAPRLEPDGVLVSSDRSTAMLEAARARAAELDVENVEFADLDVEWIDLPVASVDAVICRFGYMLASEPAGALRETRRVIRPGGRFALAVWDAAERNPWSYVPSTVLREHGLAPPQGAGAPGPFALGDASRLRQLLEDAGFQEVRIDAIDLEEAHRDFDSFWERRLDLSRGFHDVVLSQDEALIGQIREDLADRLAPYTDANGGLKIPGRVLAAAASA